MLLRKQPTVWLIRRFRWQTACSEIISEFSENVVTGWDVTLIIDGHIIIGYGSKFIISFTV